MDAKQEMDLAHQGAGRSRVTPLTHVHVVDQNLPPENPPDPDSSLPDLSAIYNLCLYQNCRPILKCGKIFSRKGLRGQYEYVRLSEFAHYVNIFYWMFLLDIFSWF